MVNMRMKLLLLLVFVVSGNWLLAQGIPEDSLRKELSQENNQEEVLGYIKNKSLSKDSLNKEYAQFGLDYSVKNHLLDWQVVFLLNQARLSIKNEATVSISKSLEALQIIEEYHAGEKEKGRAHFLLSRGLRRIGAYQRAIDHRKKQLEFALNKKEPIKEDIVMINNTIGSLFLELSESDSAIVYYRRAAQNTMKERISIEILNNIGVAFKKKGSLDSAKFYFTKAYDRIMEISKGNDPIMGYVSGNLSQCYPMEGNEKIIEQLLRTDIRLSKSFNLSYSLINAYLGLVDLKIHSRKYWVAKNYIDSAMYINEMMTEQFEKNEARLDIYDHYTVVYEKLNDFKNVLKYSRLQLNLNDSLYGKENVNRLISDISMYRLVGIQSELKLKQTQLNQSLERVEVLKKEEESSRTRTKLIIAVGILLLSLSLVFIYKMKSDAKKKREINRLNNKFYEASIENQKQRLTEATISLSRKKDFSEELVGKLSEIEGLDKRNLIPFKQYISNELQLDESILETERYISELSKDFFIKLEVQFPQLTKNDIKMCGLIRLKLSIKQIAIIKYITPESVKISKNRLSKKLGLEPGTSLYEYLKRF